jgi:hypothetical protein
MIIRLLQFPLSSGMKVKVKLSLKVGNDLNRTFLPRVRVRVLALATPQGFPSSLAGVLGVFLCIAQECAMV